MQMQHTVTKQLFWQSLTIHDMKKVSVTLQVEAHGSTDAPINALQSMSSGCETATVKNLKG